MSDGNTQAGTLAYDFAKLVNLCHTIGKGDGEVGAPLLHEAEHLHHLRAAERAPQQTVARNGKTTKAIVKKTNGFGIEAILQPVRHTIDEEALRPRAGDSGEIVILQTVDKLLHNHSSCHLSVVHIGKEHFCGVTAVNHKGREHLHLLAKEQRAPVRQRPDGQSVPRRILSQP